MKKDYEKINKRLFNRIAKYYDKGVFHTFMINFQNKVVQKINIKKNSKILDVGCGTGSLLVTLKNKNLNLSLYGIDISEEMLKIARKKLSKKEILKVAKAENLPFEKNYFDYIFCTEAFHHFSNQDRAMKNFYKSLKNQSRLIIADFDFGFIANKIFHFIEPGNTKTNTKKEMKELFNRNNFKNVEQEKIGIFVFLTRGIKQ